MIEEFKLRVIYIPANPPSPVPEGSEEGSSPRASVVEDGNQSASLSDAVSICCMPLFTTPNPFSSSLKLCCGY